jgi:hypothetical protein
MQKRGKIRIFLKAKAIKESNKFILNITIKREKTTIEQEIKIRRKELKG